MLYICRNSIKNPFHLRLFFVENLMEYFPIEYTLQLHTSVVLR